MKVKTRPRTTRATDAISTLEGWMSAKTIIEMAMAAR
jgi:hypothetical protein